MLIDGVVKLFPDPNTIPPDAELYQFKVPALAVAPKVTVPESHTCDGEVDVILGVTLIVAVTGVLVELQVPKVAST